MSSCQICGTDDTEELLDWSEYKIIRCKRCRLLFASPLPTNSELEKYYQGFMFKPPSKKEVRSILKRKKAELRKIFNLPNSKEALSNRSFLDFGAGTGTGYKAARDLGLNSYYHDLDKQALNFTKEYFGLTPGNVVGDIENCNIKFDYIFSDNVVEHVKDPLAFVNILVERLNGGGTLILKTPHGGNTEIFFNPMISLKSYYFRALRYNSSQRVAKAYLKRFWHCDPPRHLYSFTAKSLKHLASNLKQGGITYEVSYYSLRWFNNTFAQQLFTKYPGWPTKKLLRVRVVALLLSPLEVILQTLKWVLLNFRVLSPGGIILIVTKSE